ncbi:MULTISPECIES: prepilin-type N-terminal cleavage/methylation domain-containing protein [unclassified Prochlorococcus]|uniref:prepilin-type N-terminal cleavage/methylation domain-containing protein n=2 Tax=unclassified Prochlorococcus TaxID=2627481 RepID=UPI0006901844|nr:MULTISPECIES: prepilin-type N-terminal cleavage/methylation domain-containing protein [unclassified Prochlorococcus]
MVKHTRSGANLKKDRWNQTIDRILSNHLLKPYFKQIHWIRLSQQKQGSCSPRENTRRIITNQLRLFSTSSNSNQTDQQNRDSGFTMVEVLIAGVLLAMVMTAVSRFSLSALINSRNQLERTRIEAAINDNIQLLQQADSLLTFDSIPSQDEQQSACNDPPNYLKEQIIESAGRQYVPAPNLKNESNKQLINRTVNTTAAEEIAVVIYSFEGPGATTVADNDSAELLHETEMKNATEQRVLELNPNFQARCYK